MQNIFFNAHHSPFGAFASFTLGYKGASGGLGLELGKPADQNVWIGVEDREGGDYHALPFFMPSADDDADAERLRYQVEHFQKDDAPAANVGRVYAFADEEITRNYSLGLDAWRAGGLTFTIYTQAGRIPDPDDSRLDEEELKARIVPALLAELTIDNTQGTKTRRAFFGYSGKDPYAAMRQLDDMSDGRFVGVGQGRMTAIASADKGVYSGQAFSMASLLNHILPENLAFGLGGVGALLMDVPAGEKRTYRFAICFYRDGAVTAGLDTKYYYTRFFKSIEDVAAYVLDEDRFWRLRLRSASANGLLSMAHLTFEETETVHYGVRAIVQQLEPPDRDAAIDKLSEYIRSKRRLSDDQLFMLGHAIRSYYGSTQLLEHDGKPLWVVNEGEYRMINTFDLTVDQLFYEMRMNPWTVRNVLDLFATRYSYHDTVQIPGDPTEYPGGISFTHDMGVANVFSRPGYSSYERAGTEGCWSYMTHEQLVNWVCCAAVYAHGAKDETWLAFKLPLLEECLQSLVNRDHPDPEQRNGVMGLDTARTRGVAEITTYDSLDTSLGQARNNIYLAVKTWAGYVLLDKIFTANDNKEAAELARKQAALCAATLASRVTDDGYIPAVIDEGSQSRIIPAIEGLIFPFMGGAPEAVAANGPYGELIAALRRHFEIVLRPGVCLFPDGGWKLSSTSDNSWLSKIYLCQFVARRILGIDGPAVTQEADAAHVNWLLHPEESYHAWSDQMVAGVAQGSKYYPRGVTSILWLLEEAPEQADVIQ